MNVLHAKVSNCFQVILVVYACWPFYVLFSSIHSLQRHCTLTNTANTVRSDHQLAYYVVDDPQAHPLLLTVWVLVVACVVHRQGWLLL
jgi:hypothetical protein